MGHSSKFVFPLPGRRTKHAPVPPTAAPLTKAQKILGTTELNVDAPALPAWETHSNSGISIAVTETTNGERGHGSATHDVWVGSKALRDRRWEQESEIIPATLNRQTDMAGSMAFDGTTDVSSLRRRQSSSTITSYYDKAKLPLSISQQTSNSAMAKGLPAKAQALLDIDGEFVDAPAVQKARKKPSRLDLSSLLQKHRTPKYLHPDPNNAHVLGNDMLTKSPSLVSVSSASTPPPIAQRAERGIRKKLTKESLRETRQQQMSQQGQAGRSVGSTQQPSKADVDLYNLYDHYEQRTFADVRDQTLPNENYQLEPPTPPPSYPPPVPGQSGKAFLSPFPSGGSRASHVSKQSPLTVMTSELKLAGSDYAAADTASVSSRHTRTSKASRRTDRSMQEIDLLQNSVLALSSDSEDDYEISSKGSLAVPALSDGQASPTSPRSPMSQTSGAGFYDGGRAKPPKRTSFATSPQIFPTGHSSASTKAPKIGARTSSLNPKVSTKSSHVLAHETSRLSIGTTSTDRTVSYSQGSNAHGAGMPQKSLKKMRSDSQFDFPAPPVHRPHRASSASRLSEQSMPVSPTSVDLYLQSQRSPLAPDNGSIRSATSLGSAMNQGRRGSATSSIHDGNSGRFMAVTRQEEMLLAALRMKRARMREDIIAEFEEEVDLEEHQLRREFTNDSTASVSRRSSKSTMRQETGTLSARPRPQVQTRVTPAASEVRQKGVSLKVQIDRTPFDPFIRTPVSEISDFIHFDDAVSSPGGGSLQRQDSKASSISSRKSAPGRQRPSLSPMAVPSQRPQRREGGSSRKAPEQTSSPQVQMDLPHRILEDPAEDDEDGIPRPDSPISPSDFPAPVSIKNNKQVRLSAVGFYKPNAESAY